MRHEIINYKHFGKCVYATNEIVEVIIPVSFGIRIISYALVGGKNIFFEQPSNMKDLTTEDGWKIYGGHRLWVSPESPLAYYPDNEQVEVDIQDNRITVRQKLDRWLNVRKRITIIFSDNSSVEVVHKIKNCADEKQKYAAWAISSLAAGGEEVISIPQSSGSFSPWQTLTAWDYTNIGDKRALYKSDSIRIRQAKGETKFKIGLSNTLGIYEYHINDNVFEVRSNHDSSGEYSDNGMCFETFICNHMLELETLSPMRLLMPGESMEHTEIWSIREKR